MDGSAYGAPPAGYPPAGYPPPEYAGYAAPPADYYGAPPADAAAAAAAGYAAYGYGAVPPGYPGYPGYGDPAMAAYYGYGAAPPGYPGYPPEYAAYGAPPPGYPVPGATPALGYGPAEGSHSGDRDSSRERGRDRDRDRGGRNRGGRKRGDGGGYGKAQDDRGRHKDHFNPYGGGPGGAPPLEPVQANNLYVTGLPSELEEGKLRDLFNEHGKVSQCKMFPPRSGETKTVALIRFETPDDAKMAKDAMHGRTIEGFSAQISVRFAENKAARDKDLDTSSSGVVRVTGPGIDGIVSTFEAIGPLKATRGHEHHKGQLYVAGLPPDTSNVHLYRLFAPFGSIGPKGVHAMLTPDGRCKGIAFVNFLEEEAAQLAIATYNGAVLPDGTTMKVSMKMSKNS